MVDVADGADVNVVLAYVEGLGYLGFRGLGFRGLGDMVWDLGLQVGYLGYLQRHVSLPLTSLQVLGWLRDEVVELSDAQGSRAETSSFLCALPKLMWNPTQAASG